MLRFLALLLPLSAWANETTSPNVGSGTFVQAGLALALIVSVLFGLAWLARKLNGGKGFGQGGMKIVGGVALGPRERIILIEVGDEWLVIGIVPGQIRTLHRLAKGATVGTSAEVNADSPFSQWLKSVTDRRHNE